MIVLSAATYTLELVLSAGTADVDVSYVDRTASAYPIGGTQQTAATATTQTILAAPAASTSREVDWLTVKIKTTGGVVTVQKLNSSGTVITQLISVTLLDEEVLQYSHAGGWCALDANGNRKEVTSSVFSGITVTGLTASQAVFTDSNKALVSNAVTGSVNVMMSASPTTTGTMTATAITASGLVTANAGVQIGGGTYAAGKIYKDSTNGIQFPSATGSAYDFIIQNVAGNSNALAMTTGTANLVVGNAIAFAGVSTTASAANAYLDNGASNNLLRSTSSLKYKTDVEPIDMAVCDAIVQGICPIWYRSLAKDDRKDWSWYGVAAEDAAKIDPRLVHWTREVVGEIEEQYDAYEPVTEIVYVKHIEVSDNKATLIIKEESQQIVDKIPLFDEQGNPVIDGDTQVLVEWPRTKKIKKTRKVPVYGDLVPDGVQYERISVLMLPKIKQLLIEARNAGWKV